LRAPVITATNLVAYLESRGDQVKEPEVVLAHEDANLHEEDLSEFIEAVMKMQVESSKKHTGSQAAYEDFDCNLAILMPGFIDRLDALTVLEPGFWAYLGWKLASIVEWRHPGGQFINFGSNFGNLQESLLGRSYLRGKIGQTKEFISVPGSDLWRSHIIRVKAGNSSPISRAILALVRDKKLPVKDVRILARRINAYRSNVIFELLTVNGAEKAIGLIWDEYDKSRTSTK
jgi:hypothetical protein